MEQEKLVLLFHGITVQLTGASELLERLKLDFSFFAQENPPQAYSHITIDTVLQKPPVGLIPHEPPLFSKGDCSVYDIEGIRYIMYGYQALSVIDYQEESCHLYCENLDLLHELAYLAVHSRVGELLDKRGMHRVHALGLAYGTKGVLCLLPREGGKTTLALALLKEESITLLSDDTPLISRAGGILPFPVRIGLKEEDPLEIPGEYLGRMVRRKYGNKKLINILYYKNKLSGPVAPGAVIIGQRVQSDESAIKPVPKIFVLVPFFMHTVLGLGVPQLVEYVLRFELGDVLNKIRIVFSRIFASLKIIYKSGTYRFMIGIDKEKNARVLCAFIKKR